MKPKNDILTELSEVSPVLAALNRENVFSVPNGYFDAVSDDIWAAVRADGFGEKISPTFSLPDGYFDNLSENILAKIKIEAEVSETAQISKLVAEIGRENVFTVPQGYFEENETKIPAAMPREAKVVVLKPRNTVLKYAAAAVVTGLLALTAYFWIAPKPTNGGLASVENTKQIMAEADKIIKENSFDAVLNSMSSDEIESYLIEKGTDVKTALVASSAVNQPDNELPAPEDYLFDDATLDKYLNKLNLEN